MLAEAIDLGKGGYVAVSVKIWWDKDTNKKKLSFPESSWQNGDLCTADNHCLIREEWNGIAIVTGSKSDVLAIDADEPKEDESHIADGLQHFQRLITEKGIPSGVVIAQTGSGGRHYLFSYSKSVENGLNPNVPGRAKLTLGGVKATIDSRINNNCLIVAPSSYDTPNGRRTYKWLTGPLPHSQDLVPAPAWLITDLNSQRTATPRPTVGTSASQLSVCPPTTSSQKRKQPTAGVVYDAATVHYNTCRPLLSAVGFRDMRLTRLKADGFDFVADRTCACPLCTFQHDSNEWYSIQICEGCFEVKNYSTRCRAKLIGLETQRQLQNIFSTPACDEVYVDVFTAHFAMGKHDQPVIWTGIRWLQFRNHYWRPVEGSAVRVMMVNMCILLMERLARCLKSAEADADLAGDTSSSSRAKERYKSVMKGVAYIKKGGNQRNVIDCLKCGLFLNVGEEPTGIRGQIELDSNPYLLGCENGIIDLKTSQLRDGLPTDWVSKSVSYDYVPTTEGRNFIETTMRQTFPVDEEREFMQRYAGYCLLGIHPEKHYMLITDMPGRRSGNNGKSTINTALRSAMGPDYAMTGIAASLYVSDFHKDENACTPGKMKYKGKRLATWEELSAKRKLDTGRMKEIHGGRATDTGRNAYNGTMQDFDWSAKYLISFNIADLPDIDFSDTQHLQRMLIMRCRSKFVSAEDYTGQPNTFAEIPNMKDTIDQHRSDILAWALDGLANYWEKRLRVPPIMDTWKAELNGSQDLIADWVGDNLEHTGDDSDFVKRSQLYQDYKGATEEERDRKKAIGKQKFFHKLLVIMGDQCYRDQIFRHHGNHRGVFLGWRCVACLPIAE